MLTELLANYASVIVAAIVLVPVLVFHVALFIEGARKNRWTSGRREVTPLPATPAPSATRQPQRVRAHSVSTGGYGLRHGVAARNED